MVVVDFDFPLQYPARAGLKEEEQEWRTYSDSPFFVDRPQALGGQEGMLQDAPHVRVMICCKSKAVGGFRADVISFRSRTVHQKSHTTFQKA